VDKKKGKSSDKYNIENSDLEFSTCSVYDCTGLIPFIPKNGIDTQSYEKLYPFLPTEENSEKQ
jgi:hypothetical protein